MLLLRVLLCPPELGFSGNFRGGGYNFTPVATGLQNRKVVFVSLYEPPLTSFCLRNRANCQEHFTVLLTVSLRAGNTDVTPVTASSPKYHHSP